MKENNIVSSIWCICDKWYGSFLISRRGCFLLNRKQASAWSSSLICNCYLTIWGIQNLISDFSVFRPLLIGQEWEYRMWKGDDFVSIYTLQAWRKEHLICLVGVDVFNLSLSGLLGELSGSFKILTLCFETYKSGSYRSPVLRHEDIFQRGRPAFNLIWERCWGHSHQAKLLWTVTVMGDREIREFRENNRKHSKLSLQHHKISLCCPSLSVPFLAQSS